MKPRAHGSKEVKFMNAFRYEAVAKTAREEQE